MAAILGTTVHQTMSYRPQANGLVERMHRQMKAALMARCSSTNWYIQLPWIMLGMRTAIKEDIGCSAAELVYGESLVVPGQFFHPSFANAPHHELLSKLRESLNVSSPVKMSRHSTEKVHRPKEIDNCPYVFVRVDARRSPLQRPYVGPFKVLARRRKAFKLQLNDRKTDYVAINARALNPQTSYRTISGRITRQIQY